MNGLISLTNKSWWLILEVVKADTSGFDNFISWICQWLVRIGIAVCIFGGVQFITALTSDNPEGKVRGLTVIAVGFMLAALGASPSIIGF